MPAFASQPDHGRRRLLRAALAGLLIGHGSWSYAGERAQSRHLREIWLSADGTRASGFHASWILDGGPATAVGSVSSDFRGHGLAQNPTQPAQAVMFARRPGRQGIVMDLLEGQIRHRFESAEGHHLHGHGVFSADGEWLFTTESDYRTGEGKLVARDTSHWHIAAEFPTHGIGPHDVRLMPDGQSLVVANGGLLTHPDSGRRVLNPDTMDSSLTYISATSGDLISQHRLSESKASIRHLDVANDGTVVIATQLQRQAVPDNRLVNLAALHRGGGSLVELTGPEPLLARFNDYMGSVAINNAARIAGFSSPRGDVAAFWHLDTGELVGYHGFHDVCGLTVSLDQRYFVLANSRGEIRQLRATDLQEDRARRRQYPGHHWDNHMFTLSLPATDNPSWTV